MEKKLGTKETQEMLTFLFGVGKLIKQAKENDGKFSVTDAPLVMALLPSVGPAIGHAEDIIAELKDIDDAELDALAKTIGVGVGELFNKEKLVEQVVKGLEVAKALLAFVHVL